jgi:ankyrin repeat protein
MDDSDDWCDPPRLHLAAEAGDLLAVQELLAYGCLVNAFDELGRTPLHFAVSGEQFAVVNYLLRHGANINARDEHVLGTSPLDEAASSCSLQMVRLLVGSGADPTMRGWMQINAVDRAKRRKESEGIGSVGQAVYEFLRDAARNKQDQG